MDVLGGYGNRDPVTWPQAEPLPEDAGQMATSEFDHQDGAEAGRLHGDNPRRHPLLHNTQMLGAKAKHNFACRKRGSGKRERDVTFLRTSGSGSPGFHLTNRAKGMAALCLFDFRGV